MKNSSTDHAAAISNVKAAMREIESQRPRPLVVAVENLKPLQNPGNVKAFCTVTIGGWKIHDVKVVQQPGQKPWVALPQARYEVNGQTKYKPIIEVPPRVLEAISAAVLSAWRPE